MTPQQLREARAISETTLQNVVRGLCVDRGLAVEHIEDSAAGRVWLPGMPDLTIFGTRILYRELKNQHNSLLPSQYTVKCLIIRAGGDWGLWRPIHLLDGTIERELDAIT